MLDDLFARLVLTSASQIGDSRIARQVAATPAAGLLDRLDHRRDRHFKQSLAHRRDHSGNGILGHRIVEFFGNLGGSASLGRFVLRRGLKGCDSGNEGRSCNNGSNASHKPTFECAVDGFALLAEDGCPGAEHRSFLAAKRFMLMTKCMTKATDRVSKTLEVFPDGTREPVERRWIAEEPVALEFNGLSYAVMMASPQNLEDFATGFALSEGLAGSAADVLDVAVAQTDLGWIVRSSLAGLGAEQMSERVRTRVAESSCGLCGIENLEALAKPLPRVAAHDRIVSTAIFAALGTLDQHQPLAAETGAAHAAAWADSAGRLQCVREDVGRHNALDKLIGALAREGRTMAGGFVLSSARCSYEIVEKTVRCGATSLVTVSLPTTMAVERAKAAGLSLWCLARDDSVLLVNDASR